VPSEYFLDALKQMPDDQREEMIQMKKDMEDLYRCLESIKSKIVDLLQVGKTPNDAYIYSCCRSSPILHLFVKHFMVSIKLFFISNLPSRLRPIGLYQTTT
jgi:hypothetical protein